MFADVRILTCSVWETRGIYKNYGLRACQAFISPLPWQLWNNSLVWNTWCVSYYVGLISVLYAIVLLSHVIACIFARESHMHKMLKMPSKISIHCLVLPSCWHLKH